MNKQVMMESQWQAHTQSGENLHFELCKGGYFSDKEEYGLKVKGKTFQDGTPTPENPVPIQCVKQGTTLDCFGKNILIPSVDKTGWSEPIIINPDQTITLDKQNQTTNFIFGHIPLYPALIGKKITASLEILEGDIEFAGETTNYWSYGFGIMGSRMNKVYCRQLIPNPEALPSFVKISGEISEYSSKDKYLVVILQTWLPSNFNNVKVRVQVELEDDYTGYEKPIPDNNTVTTPCDLYEGDIWYPMSGKVERHTKILTFDGTENWILPTIVDTDYSSFRLVNILKNILTENPHCTHFSCLANVGYMNYHENILTTFPNTTQIIFKVSNDIANSYEQTDVQEFKTWLAEQYTNGKPVTVYYKLATPTIEQYDPQPMFAPQGAVNVLQEPKELIANLEATHLVRRT